MGGSHISWEDNETFFYKSVKSSLVLKTLRENPKIQVLKRLERMIFEGIC